MAENMSFQADYVRRFSTGMGHVRAPTARFHRFRAQRWAVRPQSPRVRGPQHHDSSASGHDAGRPRIRHVRGPTDTIPAFPAPSVCRETPHSARSGPRRHDSNVSEATGVPGDSRFGTLGTPTCRFQPFRSHGWAGTAQIWHVRDPNVTIPALPGDPRFGTLGTPTSRFQRF